MDYKNINKLLGTGEIDAPGLFPHLEALKEEPFEFRIDFGLDELPDTPGLILIRGPRQYGKSTWLEQELKKTVQDYGPGSAYYLNGDELKNEHALVEGIREFLPFFHQKARVKRLFIDEITAIDNWQKALKRLVDGGELRRILVITTGSKAVDLRRGSERLPGRKGKLERSAYHFTSVPFREFKRVCGPKVRADTLHAYLLSGGSPVACNELAANGRIPEYVIEMTRDWILGEFAASGRPRASLLGVMECLFRFGGTPVGQAKLAREAGLANNTIAAGYIELLKDLMCVASSHAWDGSKKKLNRRRPCKFPMVNLLAAIAWHPARIRTVSDFRSLPPGDQAYLIEWLVAQEIWRRAAIRGEDLPEEMGFWQSKSNEIDFVLGKESFLEVKIGKANPLEFTWFTKSFPKGQLKVINENRFSSEHIEGITLEEFLLEC